MDALRREQALEAAYDADDPCCPDCGTHPCACDFEEIAAEQHRKHVAYLSSLSPDKLAEEWRRECRRHDTSVDRCEPMNNPTIEDSQGWMDWIEAEFKRRGLDRYQFLKDEETIT